MRIFQFRDPTPIEALVLACNEEDATELFQAYVREQDGDPDTLLWRELSLDHLDNDVVAGVRNALELDRAGVLHGQGEDCLVFVIRVGNLVSAEAG